MRISRIITAFFIASTIISCKQAWEEVAVSSPDLKLQLIFHLVNGKPTYELTRNGVSILLESALGFKLIGLPALDSNFILIDKKIRSFNETWEQPWGEVKTIQNNYRELILYLQEVSGSQQRMNIVFRIYNDGIGFRYEFPEQEFLDQFQIAEEKTNFVLPYNDSAWWIPAYKPQRYEYLYRKTAISEMDTVHTPLTVKDRNGIYLCFHEAALYDYPSYTIYAADSNILAVDLVPWNDGVKAYIETPFVTPWRTVQIGEEPGDLITNYLILNLNDTCKIADVSWIKPAKYVGIWWGMHIGKYTWGSGPKHGATTRNTMKYIDFAAENGFDAVLVEGWNQGWDGNWIANGAIFSFTKPYPDFNLPKLAAYAREKGVNLIGHHETSAHIDNYEAQMEDAYRLYEELGIKYLKTGYVGEKLFNGEWHYGQYGVRHYQKTVELAAKHHIMLDIHEPIKDCGLRRTWPNLLGCLGSRWGKSP
jgi:alpha-glucosidase